MKKWLLQPELSACQGNCATDQNFVYIPSLDLTVAVGKFSDERGDGLYYVISPTFQVLVFDPVDPLAPVVTARFLMESTGFEAHLDMVVSESEVLIDSGSGATRLVQSSDEIDAEVRTAFETAIAPLGANFRENLVLVVAIVDAGGPMEGLGPMLKDLLGMDE